MGVYVYGNGCLTFSDETKALEAINNSSLPERYGTKAYDSLEDVMLDFGFSGKNFSCFETEYDHTDELLPVIRPFIKKGSHYEFKCDDEHNYWSWSFNSDKPDINSGDIYYDNDPYAIEHFIKQASSEMLMKALEEKLKAAETKAFSKKKKHTAFIEFAHVKEIQLEFDEDNDDPDEIILEMLQDESCELHKDYTCSDHVCVSYRYADGSESNWVDL